MAYFTAEELIERAMEGVTHAGIAVVARDTGRVLMQQRCWDEEDADDVRGTWEFPGGGLEEGETPEEGAWREFSEETGLPMPTGETVNHWISADGVYMGFVYAVEAESSAFPALNPDLDAADTVNPDDPQRVNPDVTAWFTTEQAQGLGAALRPEIRDQMDWSLLDLEEPMTERIEVEANLGGDLAVQAAVNENPGAMVVRTHKTTISAAETVPEAKTARKWFGVLAPEGVKSGDGRGFTDGALRMRSLPLPLTWQKVAGSGHDGNITVASIQEIWRDSGLIWGAGDVMDTPEADEWVDLVTHFGRYGVSIDADDLDEFSIEMDEEGTTWFTDARACSACTVSIPAFAEAFVMIGDYNDFAADFAGGWGTPSQPIPTKEGTGQAECEHRDEDGNCVEREPDNERVSAAETDMPDEEKPCDPEDDPECVAEEDSLPEKERPPFVLTEAAEMALSDGGSIEVSEVLFLEAYEAGRIVEVGTRDDGAVLYDLDPEFKDYTDAERKDAHTLPDGSYPIEDCADLKNAIQAIGRAKDPAKAKAHIRSRKSDLGCPEVSLPDTWATECDDCVADIPFEEWNGTPLPDTRPFNANSAYDHGIQMKDLAPGLTEDGPGWLTHPVDTDRLRDYWVRGPGAAKIGWGTPDDFYRCEAAVAEYVKPQYLKGYCANRHYDALGYWPGQAPHKGEAIAMTASIHNGVEVGESTPIPALTASAPMKDPPREWFDNPNLPMPTPLTVTEEGRVFGHLGTWGQCHVGIGGQCVMLPHSANGYAYFHLGEVETDKGPVFTGPLVIGGKHAPDRMDWRAATQHYDTTSAVFADICVGEDEHGVWMSGAMREGVTDEQIREAKAAGKASGDWREVRRGSGQIDLIAGLVVNVGGFTVPRTSIHVSQGRVTSLVAAGVVIGEDPVMTELVDEVAARLEERAETRSRTEALRARFDQERLARLRERL